MARARSGGISPLEARRFYDRFGRLHDLQRYERSATDAMVDQLSLHSAESVFELGCGTGRLARQLLSRTLSPACRYNGVDVSYTMVEIARKRIARYAPRAAVERVDGGLPFCKPAASFDRFIATYVLDLFDEEQIRCAVSEAARLLKSGGLLGIVSLTDGERALDRAITRVWAYIQRLSPRSVGGCRPIDPACYLDARLWALRHVEVVSSLAIPSAVVVAARRQGAERLQYHS